MSGVQEEVVVYEQYAVDIEDVPAHLEREGLRLVGSLVWRGGVAWVRTEAINEQADQDKADPILP